MINTYTASWKAFSMVFQSFGSRSPESLMTWTNFAGISGRAELGRRKSLDSVEISKDKLNGVGTSDEAATGTGLDRVAEGTVGVSVQQWLREAQRPASLGLVPATQTGYL